MWILPFQERERERESNRSSRCVINEIMKKNTSISIAQIVLFIFVLIFCEVFNISDHSTINVQRGSKIHFIPETNPALRHCNYQNLFEQAIRENVFDPNLRKTGYCVVKDIQFGLDGNVYVAGMASLAGLLTVENDVIAYLKEDIDIFVASFSPDLKTLHQATFFGGSEIDYFGAMQIGPQGEVYIAGTTYSSDFPGIPDKSKASPRNFMDYSSGFISLLSPDLKILHHTHLLKGNNDTFLYTLIIDPENNIYAAGTTSSTIFPKTTGGAQTSLSGFNDGFVAKLSPDLKTLYQTSYLGGSDYDGINSIQMGPEGDVYVVGTTFSSDFPGIQGGFQDTNVDNFNAFISKLSADLSTIQQSTYLVGSRGSNILGIAFGPQGELYVAGGTDSSDFPGTEGGAQSSNGGGVFDGMVAMLSPDLKTLHQATYLGGIDMDVIYAMKIGPQGDIYVTGITRSPDFPGTIGGLQSSKRGELTGFIAKFSPDLKTMLQSSYLGGMGSDYPYSMIIDPQGFIYLAGTTTSSDFPGTQDSAFESMGKTSPNGFIAKLTLDLRTLYQATYTNWQ